MKHLGDITLIYGNEIDLSLPFFNAKMQAPALIPALFADYNILSGWPISACILCSTIRI